MHVTYFKFHTTIPTLLSLAFAGLLAGCESVATFAADDLAMEAMSQTPLPREPDICSPGEAPRDVPETCNELDDNCDGYVDRDLLLTECAKLLIKYVNQVAVTQAEQGDLDSPRLPLGCPAESGMGEAQAKVFSYSGKLPKDCNHMIDDDCHDIDRQNYWVSVTADRRNPDSYSYQVNWGGEPIDYTYYANCTPEGYDGPGSQIPKRLIPIRDNNGDGKIDMSCNPNNVAWIGFETNDLTNPQPILIKDIAAVDKLRLTSKDALEMPPADLQDELDSHRNLAVDIKSPDGTWQAARVRAKIGPPYLRWKNPLLCK